MDLARGEEGREGEKIRRNVRKGKG